MSSNDEVTIAKIDKEYFVFHNGCADNECTIPKSKDEREKLKKNALYKSDNYINAYDWALSYDVEKCTEYGVTFVDENEKVEADGELKFFGDSLLDGIKCDDAKFNIEVFDGVLDIFCNISRNESLKIEIKIDEKVANKLIEQLEISKESK